MPGVWRIELRINSWVLSDYFCRKQSKQKGRLIKINSKERYNELAEALYKLSSDLPYWIGLNDRQKEGKYNWKVCKDGKGEDLTDEMNLKFDDPDSHWEWMNPSKVNSWGEEEDCGQLFNWGDYTNFKATDERPIDPSDPSKQFRFNDVGCDLATVPAMPLCEKLPP